MRLFRKEPDRTIITGMKKGERMIFHSSFPLKNRTFKDLLLKISFPSHFRIDLSVDSG